MNVSTSHVCWVYVANAPRFVSVLNCFIRPCFTFPPPVITRTNLIFSRAYSIWVVYATCLVPVALSRLFIATHFPHQVVLGTMTGGYCVNHALALKTLKYVCISHGEQRVFSILQHKKCVS